MMWKYFVLILFSFKFSAGAQIESFNDDFVIEAIRENKNLIILFTKKECVECKYEQSLAALREEFEAALEAKVLKLENSHLQRIYDIQKKDAALVFLRKGVGLLYDGADNPDDIFDFFNENRDPIVKELDDGNFEHLTQATTGSTTGDWLIQFYDNQCVDCNRLTATWETVGAKLKTRLNVARVNRATKGIQTAKRFKVQRVPEFIFLRMGKYYRYNMKQFEAESFVGFATSWYSRLTPEKVTAPATPFENLVEVVVEQLKTMPSWKDKTMSFFNENPLTVLIIVSIAFILFLVMLWKRPKKIQETPQKSPRKSVKKEK